MKSAKMKKGYYSNFLRTKTLKEGVPKTKPPKVKRTTPSDLSDVQAETYRWLVDFSIIPVIDVPTREALVASVCDLRFQALFKLGRIFNVIVNPPASGDFHAALHSLGRLVRGLQEKGVLPLNVDVNKLARREKPVVLELLNTLHSWSVKGAARVMANSTASVISQWLFSLGLAPMIGDDWFNPSLSLMEDRVRNGELLRSLCVVFRPEVFEPPLPPAKTPREMVERNRQALVILAEEGAVAKIDIQRAEDIVRGTTDAAEAVLIKVKREYERRQKQMVDGVTIFDESILL